MQTFLPYPDFKKTAQVLDNRRLFNQINESTVIWETLMGICKGWPNHPATKMWKNFESALLEYRNSMIRECLKRTKKNGERYSVKTPVIWVGQIELPPWVGDEKFHIAHQSNLIRKDPEFYSPKFPNVPANLEYVWPVNK